MDNIKIVLAGQANVGKSSLINSITNSKLRVGNFSGVTVDKAEVCFHHHSHTLEIVDLPGTYSIQGFSKEEKLAKDYLQNEEYDIILNVVDATKLSRNLLLSLELLNINKKMIIALNMIDEAKDEGMIIDVAQIEAILGVDVVAVSANTKEGIDELLDKIHSLADEPKRAYPNVSYSNILEEQIFKITQFLDNDDYSYKDLSSREMAIKLLNEDEKFYKQIHDKPIFMELSPLLLECHNIIHDYYNTKSHAKITALENHSIAKGIANETIKYTKTNNNKSLTNKIDDILINKFIGIPIFLFLMWGLFQLTFTIGNIPMGYINDGIGILQNSIKDSISHEGLASLMADGIVAGVGAVLLFLPNIIILYIGITLLESTGYMSRVAFLLDGFFHKFGLHGKSFMPLVTGFGCSVPAYMATKTLKNEKDRLITLFIIGFMSCGAKLPIYVLFTGAFFDSSIAGNMLFAIYIAGALLGLVMAKILRIFVFKSEDEPFAMEMPKYRMPSIKLIYTIVWGKALSYIKNAGTFIVGVSVLIWFGVNFPNSNSTDEYTKLEQSYMGQIGKASSVVFEPLGFDWKLTVALETGLAAKETVVATLGVLYNVNDGQTSRDKLLGELKENIPFATAMAFVVFCMIYLPCFAASIVFAKEAGGYKYLGYLFVFTTLVAWIMSFLVYTTLNLFV